MFFSQYFIQNHSVVSPPPPPPPLAAANPLANHEVQAGLQSPVLCRGGGSGQRQHGGHRPQTVFCPVRQERE